MLPMHVDRLHRGMATHAGREHFVNHRVAAHPRGVQEAQQGLEGGGRLGAVALRRAEALA